jgi:hypothetical protein
MKMEYKLPHFFSRTSGVVGGGGEGGGARVAVIRGSKVDSKMNTLNKKIAFNNF